MCLVRILSRDTFGIRMCFWTFRRKPLSKLFWMSLHSWRYAKGHPLNSSTSGLSHVMHRIHPPNVSTHQFVIHAPSPSSHPLHLSPSILTHPLFFLSSFFLLLPISSIQLIHCLSSTIVWRYYRLRNFKVILRVLFRSCLRCAVGR